MMKRFLCGCLLALGFFSIACAGELAKPETLRITSVEGLKDQIYAQVSVEFPKAWMDPKFTVEVNARPVKMRHRSGGFSGDRNMADILFLPGKGGKQSVTVKAVVDGKKIEAKSDFDWKPAALLAVAGHGGEREIILAKEKLTVVTANVMDVKIFLNGKGVNARPAGSDIQTFSFEPAFRKGKNILTVSANKLDGSIIARNFTFYDLGDGGTLAVGETAMLQYGREGSKSGPFYDIKVEGDSIVALRDVRVNHNLIDQDGWLVSEVRFAREFRARKEGVSKVRIFVKPHFLQNMELEKEFEITVRNK